MKLMIDNLDGRGPQDYTPAIDGIKAPEVVRKLNQPAELRLSLVATGPEFVVPVNGARVTLGRLNGKDVFSGYVAEPPTFEFLGWGERDPIYCYGLVARSDEMVLERKTSPPRSPFVARSVGEALRQYSEEILPGALETSAVQAGDTAPWYASSPEKRWSVTAAELGVLGRASYRALDGGLSFATVGQTMLVLDEAATDFTPGDLKLSSQDKLVNDLTVVGIAEPCAYVKDYFVGDGYTLNFYLSQNPFTRSSRTIVDEEFAGLEPTRWKMTDPRAVIGVSGGKLQVAGGTGSDGQTWVEFIEKIELGGAIFLQHGNFVFSGASDGMIGGLYASDVTVGGCMAGFRITPSGTQSKITAWIQGASRGTSILTQRGHQYLLTTRLYATEVYRMRQVFHSSAHPAGQARGGGAIGADARVVLEVHDIDPANPGTMVAPATVLYDGVVAGAPGFCRYALVNAINLYGSVAFTRITLGVDAEVRSALPGQSYRTRLAGTLMDGAECSLTSGSGLQFFPQSVPAANETMVVSYRSLGRARARVTDPVSMVAHRQGSDDGVRGGVRHVALPTLRTSVDCETAALALLDDAKGCGWKGEYAAWSQYLPGGVEDVFPGDAIQVRVTSRGASFTAIVREVDIAVADLSGDNMRYRIKFADDAAEPLAFEFQTGKIADSLSLTAVEMNAVGTEYLADLTAAQITAVSSTTVTMDAGATPPVGWGIEVRRSDAGWGADNDRNLVGRFETPTFTVPRLARVQDSFMKLYDNSSPAKYSQYAAALHVDYPL